MDISSLGLMLDWQSNDRNVSVDSNGLITTTKAGSAIITLNVKDLNDSDVNVYCSCNIMC